MESEDVKTKEDMIKFLIDFRNDLIKNEEEWENPTLERYLSALERVVCDIEGYFINFNKEMPKNIQWSLFAEILESGKYYE